MLWYFAPDGWREAAMTQLDESRYKPGDPVRVAAREDVPPAFASLQGHVSTAEQTSFGWLYRVRFDGRSSRDIGTRVLAATFHQEQLERGQE